MTRYASSSIARSRLIVVAAIDGAAQVHGVIADRAGRSPRRSSRCRRRRPRRNRTAVALSPHATAAKQLRTNSVRMAGTVPRNTLRSPRRMTRQAWWLVIDGRLRRRSPPAEPEPSLVHAAAPAPVVRRRASWRPLANPATFAAARPAAAHRRHRDDPGAQTRTGGGSHPTSWAATPTARGRDRAAPSGYSPLYYASAVLPDGRVIVEGGEYIAGTRRGSTRGALYDPIANAGSEIQPPNDWTDIGDARASCCRTATSCCRTAARASMAILDPSTLTWTPPAPARPTSTTRRAGRCCPTARSSPSTRTTSPISTQSEIFTPATGQWTPPATRRCSSPIPTPIGSGSHEIGPEILRPDGTVSRSARRATRGLRHRDQPWSADCPTRRRPARGADGPGRAAAERRRLVAASPGRRIFNPDPLLRVRRLELHARSPATPNARATRRTATSCSCCRPARSCSPTSRRTSSSTRRRRGVTRRRRAGDHRSRRAGDRARAIEPGALHPEARAIARGRRAGHEPLPRSHVHALRRG